MFGRVVIVVLAAVLVWAVLARDSGASGKPRQHTVNAGETLWTIAAAQHANDLAGSTIVPGQRLVIP